MQIPTYLNINCLDSGNLINSSSNIIPTKSSQSNLLPRSSSTVFSPRTSADVLASVGSSKVYNKHHPVSMILCKRGTHRCVPAKKKPGKFDSFWQIFAENQEEMSKIYDICKCIFSMNVISIIYVLYYYMKHVVKTIGKNQDLCSSLFLVVCYPQLQKLLLINGNGNSVFKLHLVR